MGKITSTIYTLIYLAVCGATLAMGAGLAGPTWGLLALAAVLTAVLAVGGDHLDALAGQQFGAAPVGAAEARQRWGGPRPVAQPAA